MGDAQNWIFDLDDTLYPERDYVRSALCYVGSEVKRLYGNRHFGTLLLALNGQGTSDPIAQAWAQCALPDEERCSMIVAMRAHMPAISLSNGAQILLTKLRRMARPYAIVTDGRSVTQRAKIAALGCTDAAFVSISEEVGIPKLDPARFAQVETAMPPGDFVYVGDNPLKDFFAPKQIGWKTIMLNHSKQGIHAQMLPDDPSYHPDHIVNDLEEALVFL